MCGGGGGDGDGSCVTVSFINDFMNVCVGGVGKGDKIDKDRGQNVIKWLTIITRCVDDDVVDCRAE